MAQLDPIIFRELVAIQKIIDDEIWFEGERRGCAVSGNDPVVKENVCRVILRVGSAMRATLAAELAAHPGPVMRPAHEPRHTAAA